MRDTAGAGRLGSVENALRLLVLLRERGRLRVAEAARELGVARSTAHRLLATLREQGFAGQDVDRAYRPGPALSGPGAAAPSRPDLRALVRPALAELGRETGETVHLMRLEGNGVRFIDCVEAGHVLRVGSRVGMVLPAHITSGGKALLAERTTEQLRALYPQGGGFTAPSVDLSRLTAELARVRRRGYAVNTGESERGVTAVGACLRDPGGRPVAAVAVAAPTVRCPRGRGGELAERLLAALGPLRAEPPAS
ncbi:IclR family transcriptional regulator [Allonocardiopsis opalescens]|uniref:IclR family transcriptional regulator n=1 Tax=Allonocardiopsis opalescens TaxID=1144618 RepID=A0A2T0Q0H9_9ACTN|nr:IclR family transcriptional regulator [Allonocardiopsis opalescens]PRX97301.1 IclR family transcriptional regulator [Allonocardiopsis opalescens]